VIGTQIFGDLLLIRAAAVAQDLAAVVVAVLDSDRFPVVLGGDCSMVLGPMLAWRRTSATWPSRLLACRRSGNTAPPVPSGKHSPQSLAQVSRGFWAHLDVDVLGDDSMPAVDYRRPGGLTWEEAADILHGLPHASGARGLEVTMTTRTRTPAGASVRHCAHGLVCDSPGRH
jgi:arginase family enzyme